MSTFQGIGDIPCRIAAQVGLCLGPDGNIAFSAAHLVLLDAGNTAAPTDSLLDCPQQFPAHLLEHHGPSLPDGPRHILKRLRNLVQALDLHRLHQTSS